MKRFLIVLVAAALSFTLVSGWFLVRAHGQDATSVVDYGASPVSTYSVEEAESFQGWALYSVGTSFEGMPLVAVLKDPVTAPVDPVVTLIRPNDVSFIYGDCLPQDGDGCAPPLEIQISPSSSYTPADIDLPDVGRTTVRGVEGVFYEEGANLILVTGSSTVSIYGSSRDQVLRVAGQLRGVNVALSVGQQLPPPVAVE